MENLALIIPIIAIICIFGLPVILGAFVLIKLITSNKNERLELAKRGIIPPPQMQKPSPNKYRSLRNGVLCIGIAVGLIIGIIIILNCSYQNYIEFLIITSSVTLSLGLSYIVFYLLVKDKNLDNEEE